MHWVPEVDEDFNIINYSKLSINLSDSEDDDDNEELTLKEITKKFTDENEIDKELDKLADLERRVTYVSYRFKKDDEKV